jgi:hypothetical protein
MARTCGQSQGGSHTSCEKLHGRDAPVRPPDGGPLSLRAAWRAFRRVDPKLHLGFRRPRGRIGARLLQNRGCGPMKEGNDTSGIGTCARLCARQKFGKVMVRTGKLSQFCLRSRHGDCSESGALERRKVAGKAVLGDEERLGLNLRKCGSQRTSGDPEAGAAERPRCAEDGGEAACRMERTGQ